REQAQPAVGIAQRPVDEDLRLDAGRPRDVVDFLEGQFPRQDDAAEPQVAQCLGPGAVVDGQLRAAVQLQPREMFVDQVVDAQVLKDDRVHADVVQRRQGLDQLGQLVLADQGVDGDEDAAARRQAVGVGGDLVYFIQREV